MEEVVWVYFSIIAVLITFGVLFALFGESNDDIKFQNVLRSLNELKDQCDYVCSTSTGTKLPVNVVLPSGLVLYAKENRICGTFKDQNQCRVCNCNLRDYKLDLNTTFALRVFENHQYSCFFEKLKNGIAIECQG